MPASGLIQELVHGHGLNHSLALFYLLTFVRHARAEITLTANHDVTLSSNRRFKGDRLSAGLVGSIAFSSALIGFFENRYVGAVPHMGIRAAVCQSVGFSPRS